MRCGRCVRSEMPRRSESNFKLACIEIGCGVYTEPLGLDVIESVYVGEFRSEEQDEEIVRLAFLFFPHLSRSAAGPPFTTAHLVVPFSALASCVRSHLYPNLRSRGNRLCGLPWSKQMQGGAVT